MNPCPCIRIESRESLIYVIGYTFKQGLKLLPSLPPSLLLVVRLGLLPLLLAWDMDIDLLMGTSAFVRALEFSLIMTLHPAGTATNGSCPL